MRKLAPVAAAVAQHPGFQIVEPQTENSETMEVLRAVHDPAYVDAFLEGRQPLASSNGFPWSAAVCDGVLAMHAGQIDYARHWWPRAADFPIVFNLAQGFHHAGRRRGSGFCTFNGLATVAHLLAPRPVVVLDLDCHEGNGTSDFCEALPNLYNITIYGSPFSGRKGPRILDRQYYDRSGLKQHLQEAWQWIERLQPAAVLYQAGMDPHRNDPLGGYLSTDDLRWRDYTVFRALRRARVPVLAVLAGGYQEPIDELLVPLHFGTFEAAHRVLAEANA